MPGLFSQSWLFSVPAHEVMVALGLFVLFALIIAHFGSWLSLTQLMQAQISSRQQLLETANDLGPALHAHVYAELNGLRDKLASRTEDQRGRKLRVRLHAVALTGAMLTCLAASSSIQQAIVLSSIVNLIWFLSVVDLEHCLIPEKPIFAIAIVSLWATLTVAGAQWTGPVMALMGAALIGSVITLAILVLHAWKGIRGRANGRVSFGDGDVLALLALSFYFGADILSILFLSAVVFVGFCVFAEPVCRFLRRMGHHPHRDGRGMPFLPSIFIATLIVVASKDVFSLNPAFHSIYRVFVIATL